MVRAGRLDRRIKFQAPQEGIDGLGHPAKTWGDAFEVWAEYVPVAADERFTQLREAQAIRRVRFRIRYNAAISEDMRIVYEGNLYNVKSIQEIGRREGQDVIAEALVL